MVLRCGIMVDPNIFTINMFLWLLGVALVTYFMVVVKGDRLVKEGDAVFVRGGNVLAVQMGEDTRSEQGA